MSGAGERSIAAVIGDIAGNLQDLVRSEIRLAKVEAKADMGAAARAAMFVAAGGGVAILALALAALAGVYALALVVPPWAAALIVAGVAAAIGGVLLATGFTKIRRMNAILPRTAAAIKESVEWAKPSAK